MFFLLLGKIPLRPKSVLAWSNLLLLPCVGFCRDLFFLHNAYSFQLPVSFSFPASRSSPPHFPTPSFFFFLSFPTALPQVCYSTIENNNPFLFLSLWGQLHSFSPPISIGYHPHNTFLALLFFYSNGDTYTFGAEVTSYIPPSFFFSVKNGA